MPDLTETESPESAELASLKAENVALVDRVAELELQLGNVSGERDVLREENARLVATERNFEAAVARQVCKLGISSTAAPGGAFEGGRGATLTEQAQASRG